MKIRQFENEQDKQDRFLLLLNPIYKNLERYALSISSNYEDAKELVAETVFNAFQNFDTLRHEGQFLSFLFTIAYRINLKRYKQQKYEDIDEYSDFLENNELTPEEEFDLKVLKDAINRLPQVEKDCIILSEINGFKHSEIAEITGLTVSNIKDKIHRAKKMLQKMILDNTNKIELRNEVN